jgi:uncharacterized LabA/DUF88 family protein
LVRFFGRTRQRRTSTEGAEEEKPTRKTTKEETPEPKPPLDEKPAPRRRTTSRTTSTTRTSTRTTRPPRRDWAAEAAATPAGEPAPRPASQATTPSEDADGATPATKRRRGTRGGRGRKKATTAETAAPEAPREMDSLEAIVARQASVLETFAKDVSTTLKGLQTAVTSLQAKVAEQTASVSTTNPRVGIFVDVPNVIYAAERRNITLDFGRVLEYFTKNRVLVTASAYAPISDDPQAKLENQRFVQHFIGHPYRIVTKPLKRFADGSMKANFDIELAIDILTMSDRLDVVVLMSGDGDFRRLVELISSRGVRVEVVAFSESASAELKTIADRYVDIGTHLDEFRAKK